MINLKLVFVSLLVFCCTAMSAQRAEEQKKIKYLFPEGDIRWIRHYESSGLSMPGTTLTLGWDGSLCRGLLTHVYSGDVFMLKGYLKRDSLFMEEFDSENRKTASLKGTLSAQQVSLRWSGSKTLLQPLQLSFSALPESEDHVPNCRDHHQVRIGHGKFGNRTVDILVQHLENSGVVGILNFSAPNEHFVLKGHAKNHTYRLQAEKSDGLIGVELVFTEAEQKKIRGVYSLLNGSKDSIDLQFSDEFKLFCLEYSDYSSYYQLVLPLGEAGTPLNKWSKDLFAAHFTSVQQQLRDFKAAIPVNGPETRAVNRTTLWCELLYNAPNLMSGMLHFSSEQSGKNYERPFVFDLVEGKELRLDDVVKDRKKLKVQCRKWLENQQGLQVKGLSQRIEKESLEQFSLCSDGLVFYTMDKSEMSEKKFFVPFSEIGSNLQKTTSIYALLK